MRFGTFTVPQSLLFLAAAIRPMLSPRQRTSFLPPFLLQVTSYLPWRKLPLQAKPSMVSGLPCDCDLFQNFRMSRRASRQEVFCVP